jgi:hypothetical protein
MFTTARAPQRLLHGFVLGVFLFGLSACRRPEPAERTVDNLDDVLAAVPDSAMRERWRAAQSAGQLPPLESLRVPTNPLSTRRPATVDTSRPSPPSMQIPQNAVADARALLTPPLSDYEGGVIVETIEPNRIVARLSDSTAGAPPQGRIEIHYKLPAGAQLVQLPASAALSLSFHESLEDGSLRRIIGLMLERTPVLLRVSDGDRQPYARNFPAAQLSVRQNAPGTDSVSTVMITYGGRTLTLRPGDRQRTRDARGELEFFLESSYYTPPARVALSEGDPYHVRLMVYRVRAPAPG